jgi:hypothetical protein
LHVYTKAIAIVALTAMLVAIVSTAADNVVAQLARTKMIQGGGSGSVACPGSTTPVTNMALINFDVTKQKGHLEGNLVIRDNVTFAEKMGVITDGVIKKQSYALTGMENQDTLCHSAGTSVFSVRGLCGNGVRISFVSADGERGIFTGNVKCPV